MHEMTFHVAALRRPTISSIAQHVAAQPPIIQYIARAKFCSVLESNACRERDRPDGAVCPGFLIHAKPLTRGEAASHGLAIANEMTAVLLRSLDSRID